MQCQSYPVYYTHNDLLVDANGSRKPQYTGHVTAASTAASATGRFGQSLLDSPAAQGFLELNKQLLRQTILHQEATFKDQVQELHRLYRRQKELLNDIKRKDVYMKHVHSKAQSSSNSLRSNVSFRSTQKTVHNILFDSFIYDHLSNSGAKNIQTLWTSTGGESITAASHISQNMTRSNILDLTLSQRKRAQRKQLDPQLPADEYINRGREYLRDFGISGVSIVSTHTSDRACPVVGNAQPPFVSSSPTTFSSQMIDLTKFPGSKITSSGTVQDYQNRKKLKICMETDKTDVWRRRLPSDEDNGKSRSSFDSFGWYSYSQSSHRSAEVGRAYQATCLSTNKDGCPDNGRTDTNAKIFGSVHEMLNLNNSPGKVEASHRPIVEYSAPHSGMVNSQMPSNLCRSQVDVTLGESLSNGAVPCLSPDFSVNKNDRTQCKSQAPVLNELNYISRYKIIQEKGRSSQSSHSESNVKASASSGFHCQSFKCELASADNQLAKHMNCLGSLDLNSSGVAHFNVSTANDMVSRERMDDLTSPRLQGSCQETHLRGSISSVDQTELCKKPRLFDINLPCDPTTDMARLENDTTEDDYKHSDLIKLEPLVKDHQLSSSPSSPKRVLEVDLEAPISPEKQECPRPRGESEENKTEISLHGSIGEDGDSLEELMKTAVEVLISISSSEAQPHLSGSEMCQASGDDRLNWFAGLVCSTELGEGFLLSNSKDAEKCEVLSSTGIDYFEAMTLKLTETPQEDYCYNNTTLHSEKEICDTPLSNESGSSRTTKRVRKDFRREVLPSLASLSRHDVTEDIQIIERLMESAGTPLKMGVKTRKMGGDGMLRGRKKSRICTIASAESRTCLLALPQIAIPGLDLKDKGRRSWENMPRQPRGQRCRTISPHATLSQEGWMRKWGGVSFLQKERKKHKHGI